MPFEKGKVANPKGRPKKAGGAINASSKLQLKEMFNKNLPKIWTELEQLKGSAYFNALAIIAPYCLPKLSVTDISVTSHQIDDKYKGLSVDALREINKIMLEDKDSEVKLLPND